MRKPTIIERLNESPVVFDGAMGTMLYKAGVFINRCFDELSLTDPDLVQKIHREYVESGADAIETNTFGANRIWLSHHGLADKTVAINRAGAKLARGAAGEDVYVGGSIGPCLRSGQILSKQNRAAVRAAFEECSGALAEGGVDFLQLETFFNVDELLLAVESVAGTGLPIIASMVVGENGETSEGKRIDDIIPILNDTPRVGAVGMNCGSGPGPLFASAERAVGLTEKPLILMPNAGRPQEVEGRMLYLANPEYFTEYAKRFIELGARGVGGCCGTTPEHIRVMSRAVRTLSGVKKHIEVRVVAEKEVEVESIPMADKTPFGAKLVRGEKVSSVEILPPRSMDLDPMLSKVRLCHAAGIDAINIPDGPRASARISPMITSLTIQREVGIEPILHYCCRDRNLIGMQSDLMGGYAAGLANFLIITGDPPKIGDYPDVTGVFDVDAIGLTRVAWNLNHGYDIGGNPINPPAGILIGVGCNPCAVSMPTELDRYRRKIEAGAEYAITQPIFDPEALLRFLDDVGKFPKTIPIVAGVWPLTSLKNAEFMNNEVPGVEIPATVIDKMRTCKTREDGLKMGVEVSREIRDRIAPVVAGFQVSAPFGKVDMAIDVLS